jgi:hypothetical protein
MRLVKSSNLTVELQLKGFVCGNYTDVKAASMAQIAGDTEQVLVCPEIALFQY